ncbi:MAG: hypothetical protein QOK23_1519 [Gammaproteobacteria bacterium]|jgi:hypothetical protein|nr:hypothetical protein [Gammaproteobacteria bacterium]
MTTLCGGSFNIRPLAYGIVVQYHRRREVVSFHATKSDSDAPIAGE